MQSTKSSVSEMPFGDDEKPFEHQPKAGYNIKGSHFKFFLKNVHQMSNYLNRMHSFHHIFLAVQRAEINNKYLLNPDRVKKVPVICMYGETDSKKTVMVYVHNYFPYFYIPSNKREVDRDITAVIAILSNDSRLHGGSTRS